MRVERIGDCTLMLADNRDVLGDLAPVDLLLTDPPYGIGESNEKNLSRGTLAAPKDYGTFSWDQETVPQSIIDLAISKARWAAVFGGELLRPPSNVLLARLGQNERRKRLRRLRACVDEPAEGCSPHSMDVERHAPKGP